MVMMPGHGVRAMIRELCVKPGVQCANQLGIGGAVAYR